VTIIWKLSTKNITIRETLDQRNVRILFEHKAIVDMLEFIETTEVGKRLVAESNKADS
jgi:hypothetical protein